MHIWSLQHSLLKELWFIILIHKCNQYNYTSLSIIILIPQMVNRGRDINIKKELTEERARKVIFHETFFIQLKEYCGISAGAQSVTAILSHHCVFPILDRSECFSSLPQLRISASLLSASPACTKLRPSQNSTYHTSRLTAQRRICYFLCKAFILCIRWRKDTAHF